MIVATLTALATAVSAAKFSPVGHWKFDEPADATKATDSSGNRLHGNVGEDVNTGRGTKRTFYNFPASGSTGDPNIERLVLVPDADRLDPRDDRYRIAFSIRTRAAGVNILQKGQSRTSGGFWKIETHDGLASCLFRGADGQQSGVGSGQRVDDGKWHKIVCTRFADRVVMRVDGKVTDTRRKPSGTIANTKPLSIGGKSQCGGSVGCDYYVGDIDYVRISRG